MSSFDKAVYVFTGLAVVVLLVAAAVLGLNPRFTVQTALAESTPQPVTERLDSEKPVPEKPVSEKPVAEYATVETPVAENPVAENPVVETPVPERPVAEQPVAEQTVVMQTAATQPVTAQAVASGAGLEGYAIGQEAQLEGLERVQQTLVAPPFVPEHTQTAEGDSKIVEVRLEIQEKEIEVAPGAFVQAMTYEGSVPGPLIVVHEGDYVELTLVNPATNTLVHNIDFHAATGALGGGELTLVAPGQEVVLRFKAVKAGVFVYHCAPGGAMIPFHVVSGMNGAIMVLPRDGLKDAAGNSITYDRAYYIGEQDFYIPQDADGTYKRYDNAPAAMADTLARVTNLTPSHEVFNGAVGALTGDNAMTVKVGETVLLIHSQANRDTRPHLIGGHGDYVWERGNFNDDPVTGIETWFIAGGSAGAAVYTFQQPGVYTYLNHNLIEAVLLGAAGQIKVDGEWNLDLMEQVSPASAIGE